MAQEGFPLHALVWNNQYLELDRELQKKEQDVESLDPKGAPRWSWRCVWPPGVCPVLLGVLQVAVSTGDPELVQRREDFYVEMKWGIHQLGPLVSKVCPSDVYRVWKSGSCLRVDTTLLGFEHMTWLKGRRSYIFKGEDEGAVVMEVDHEKQVVYTEPLVLSPVMPPPSWQPCSRRRRTQRRESHRPSNKSGIWGWRSEKSEAVSGYEAKVYSATNVELVTRSRTEHLSDQDNRGAKAQRLLCSRSWGLLNNIQLKMGVMCCSVPVPTTPPPSQPEDFDPEFNLNDRDIGRPVELNSKVQRFKATLWLSESHPLSLAEQVTPIIDLMAISNAHFAKLRDFITLRLPPGFPVKIEIPLFHVLNARVTFSNLCGCDEPVSSVTLHTPVDPEEAGQAPPPFQCEVDPSVFEPPADYATLGPGRSEPMRDEDDNLLQFAIQQSLLDAGTESEQVTIWEALTNTRPVPPSPLYEGDSHLERAIQESLSISLSSREGEDTADPSQPAPVSPSDPPADSPLSYSAVTNPRLSGHFGMATSFDEQLRLAMEISCREQEEIDRREETELERILQLSLTEK
ncbi:hypothetical protein KUCAC02_004891 [Chaenocephalus aceratus]|uniref:Uncharacterized protein n=1 Tax=Chaenocephalus aceratus TaxID=36190 RepID=A0ACB9WZY4_CHAAC|nr:hypothetical protein KUCAC02_004891 [Chaenocephalus aceratus]